MQIKSLPWPAGVDKTMWVANISNVCCGCFWPASVWRERLVCVYWSLYVELSRFLQTQGPICKSAALYWCRFGRTPNIPGYFIYRKIREPSDNSSSINLKYENRLHSLYRLMYIMKIGFIFSPLTYDMKINGIQFFSANLHEKQW